MNEVLSSGGWTGTGEVQLQHLKKFFKRNFEKPLDNNQILWYNKDVPRDRDGHLEVVELKGCRESCVIPTSEADGFSLNLFLLRNKD